MRGKGALGLLLLVAGCLIYAANHQQREAVQAQRSDAPRFAKTSGPPELAWIGPIPANFSEEVLARRLDRVLARVMRDVPAGPDAREFECKLPAQVGPVPMQHAVDAYVRGLPGSRTNPVLTRNLHRAAERGNWLAKVQVYHLLSEHRAPDHATAYRTLKLMEWMQKHRIGALYAALGEAVAASDFRDERAGSGPSRLDTYAAMHHSYPSQYKVGRELARSDDPEQSAAGRRMLDCAAKALPGYRPLQGEAVAARH